MSDSDFDNIGAGRSPAIVRRGISRSSAGPVARPEPPQREQVRAEDDSNQSGADRDRDASGQVVWRDGTSQPGEQTDLGELHEEPDRGLVPGQARDVGHAATIGIRARVDNRRQGGPRLGPIGGETSPPKEWGGRGATPPPPP